MDRFAPCGVIVNEDLKIVQFRGRTSPYLEPAPGEATFQILKMAREGLLFDLRACLHKARQENRTVRKEALQVRHEGRLRTVNLEVIPLLRDPSHPRCLLVLFQEAPPASRRPTAAAGKPPARDKAEERELARLRRELTATKQHLQSIIEEQEATNEELKSANEEILSANEELQSTNEELETAKEELQSSNEELTTVNEELHNRNLELSQSNNDMTNLLVSVRIPVVMLGSDLRIRRFTPMAEKVLNLIPTDVGRPITDLKVNLHLPQLEQLVLDVIDSVTTRELEVQDSEGRWYSLQIRPYKTAENRIDGVVLALLDIDAIKRSHQTLLEQLPDFILTVDSGGRILYANHTSPTGAAEPAVGESIYDQAAPEFHPAMRECLQRVLQTGEPARFEAGGVGRHADCWFSHRVGAIRRDRDIMALSVVVTDLTARGQVAARRGS